MSPDSPTETTEPPQPTARGDVAVVILTAGRSTRMKSALSKLLHPVCGLPMIEHVVRSAVAIDPRQVILTLGPTSEAIRELFAPPHPLAGRLTFAWQPEALGTGDATAVAMPLLDPRIERVVVIFGDHPTVTPTTLRELVDTAERDNPIAALVTVRLDPSVPYGRYVWRDGRIVGLVEAYEDPNTYDGPIMMNSGMCCYRRDWLEEHIRALPLSAKGEYYLTALVERAAATDWPVNPVVPVEAPPDLALGVNDRADLALVERIMRERINTAHMRAGVTLVDPATTYIDADVVIGPDTRIEPGCMLRGRTTIGDGCTIGPHAMIEDSRIGDHVSVLASWIEGAEIGEGTHVGPFSHFRAGARIAPRVHIGNYVEVKNAEIGSGTHVGHFSYIGDATLGERVNIGAGTVTCNFDGRSKHRTEIGDDVFIGSDTMLIAPVSVGDGGATGAGAVVTHSVPAGQRVAGVPARPLPPRRDEGRGTGDERERGRGGE